MLARICLRCDGLAGPHVTLHGERGVADSVGALWLLGGAYGVGWYILAAGYSKFAS